MRLCAALFLLITFTTSAAAQSTYVGASVVGDLARFGGVDYDDEDLPRIQAGQSSVDDEAIGFNVRIGRAITDRWGVEFEYARSGTFEDRYPYFLPAFVRTPSISPPGIDAILPYVDFDVDSERRHSSMTTLVFVRQDVSEAVELSFLGGIAFNRVETEHDYDIDIRRLAIYPPIFQDVETTEYHVGPAVGVEAAWRFTGSAALTGGVRLHGVNASGMNGWLLRPNVGLRWKF